jgi:hypothetical protein
VLQSDIALQHKVNQVTGPTGHRSWAGAAPLAGSALLFWIAYRLQHGVQS